jgi:hypothetical protein
MLVVTIHQGDIKPNIGVYDPNKFKKMVPQNSNLLGLTSRKATREP